MREHYGKIKMALSRFSDCNRDQICAVNVNNDYYIGGLCVERKRRDSFEKLEKAEAWDRSALSFATEGR